MVINSEGNGTFKKIVESDDSTLTLEARTGRLSDETQWLSGETPNFLSEAESKSYALSQFYLRRLLHTIRPDLFPDCHFVSGKTIVVEKKNGKSYSWENLKQQRLSLEVSYKEMGLNLAQLDTTGARNFMVDEDENIFYIDSIVNTGYFSLLNMLRIMKHNPDHFNNLDDEDFLIDISKLAYASTKKESYSRPEIDFSILDKILEKKSPKVKKRLKAQALRLRHHYSTFPSIDKTAVAIALNQIYESNKQRIKTMPYKFDAEVEKIIQSKPTGIRKLIFEMQQRFKK